MKKVGSFIGDWWRLVSPYFRSEEWPYAIPLLIGAIALTLGAVFLEVLFNEWSRRFYDSLQNKDEAAFWREMITFCWIAALMIMAFVARAIVSPYLRLRWRRWLTRRFLAHWLDSRGYYRIELQRSVDNADQRIAEDLRFLGEYTMQLFLGFLGAVATLISFLFILWTLSGPLSLIAIGLDINIPGYMAWVCLIYALGGTLLANMVGRRLIPLNFQKQRFEANFRFALVRVRENAEGIALYRGEEDEAEALNARFTDVFNNGWRVLFTQVQLAFYQSGYAQLAIIFPYLVTAPRFFAGAITLGVMTQTASAFGQVQSALSFFIDNYTVLAELRAVMDRLLGLQAATDHKQDEAIELAPEAGRSDVGVEGSDARPAQRADAARRHDAGLRQGPVDADLGRERLGQEHAVPRAGRHLAVRQRPCACARGRARAVPAAEALYPDRHAARRGEVSRREFDGGRWRDHARRWRRRASPTSPPASTRRRTGPTSCRAASSSVSRSRGRWCSSRTGCSSTKRLPRSTRRRKRRSTPR